MSGWRLIVTTMTNSDKMRFQSPSRSVSNHSPSSARQDQVRSSTKSRASGPRPLGTPASDISMYYDRRMAAVHNSRSTAHRKGRMGLCASADMERRRNGHQNKGYVSQNFNIYGLFILLQLRIRKAKAKTKSYPPPPQKKKKKKNPVHNNKQTNKPIINKTNNL